MTERNSPPGRLDQAGPIARSGRVGGWSCCLCPAIASMYMDGSEDRRKGSFLRTRAPISSTPLAGEISAGPRLCASDSEKSSYDLPRILPSSWRGVAPAPRTASDV